MKKSPGCDGGPFFPPNRQRSNIDRQVKRSTMQRILRGIFWIIKALLLAIAVAALILWPSTSDKGAFVFLEKYSQAPDHINQKTLYLNSDQGQIAFGQQILTRKGQMFDFYSHWLADHPQAASWKLDAMTGIFLPTTEKHSLGPVAWSAQNSSSPNLVRTDRHIVLDCWFIALLTTAWPLTSLTLLIHRRIRHRRLTSP